MIMNAKRKLTNSSQVLSSISLILTIISTHNIDKKPLSSRRFFFDENEYLSMCSTNKRMVITMNKSLF